MAPSTSEEEFAKGIKWTVKGLVAPDGRKLINSASPPEKCCTSLTSSFWGMGVDMGGAEDLMSALLARDGYALSQNISLQDEQG